MPLDWDALLADNPQPDDTDWNTASIRQALNDGAVVPLRDVGIIEVVGEDARSFLQSQLTQDIQDLGDEQWRLSGYCNPKGRLFGLFQVLLGDNGLLLLTHRELVDGLLRRLRMFVLRAKATLADVSDDYAAIGLVGNGPLERLEGLAGSGGGDGRGVHRAGDLMVLGQPGEPQRRLLLVDADEVATAWQALHAGAPPAHRELWTLLDIRTGMPAINPATTETFVPQQVNLELIEGVHFKKGCYPGQEIVARMHYLGKPSRRMYRLLAPLAESVPKPGAAVNDGEGNNAGEVVQAARGPEGVELLAVLKTAFRERQDLQVAGAPAEFLELPYEV